MYRPKSSSNKQSKCNSVYVLRTILKNDKISKTNQIEMALENMKMSKWITKQTFLFFLLCFGGTYLMGILLGCAYLMGYDTSVFARTQMLYPAAAVIISLFITKKNETLPTRFFQSYLIITGLAILCLVIGVVTKTQWWTSLASVCIYGGNLWCLWELSKTELDIKEVFGLSFVNKRESYFMVCVFGVLFILRQFIYGGIQGEWNILGTDFSKVFIGLVMLLPNFFLAFISFFGEEYGWRYYLQPVLQKKFGNRLGVILLGSLWGIWHLPLEIFYYFSPEVSGWGVLNRQIVCISIGVFFAYAYMRTKNIWVPIILHYMNNNLAWFFNVNAANTELSPLLAVVESVVPSMIVFLPFIFSRVFSANNDSKETVT